MKNSKKKQILKLAEKKGILRPKDVEEEDLPRQYVYKLLDQDKLEKVGRGLYKLPEHEFSGNQMLLEVARKAPDATICLLSALRFHEMTTQNPNKIWIAIHHKDRAPRIDVPLEVVRMTGESLTSGRQEHLQDNIAVNVYNPAKTVADCFKFRNKIGLEIALEALRDYREQNKGTMAELWKYAKTNRVQNILQPYAEAQP